MIRSSVIAASLWLAATLCCTARPGVEIWRYTARAGILSSPAIGPDGTIYFGADDGNLYAVSDTGSNRWIFPMYEVLESSPAIGDDGTIYAGSGFGVFYALNPDGTVRW